MSRRPDGKPLDPAVRVERLSRSFGSVAALADVSLAVRRGGVTGLLGPNGAGKTTLLRILLGLVAPGAGRVEVLGRDPAAEGTAVRSASGAVFEHDGLYERLSGRENLEFHARIRRLPDRAERIDAILARFGIAAHGDRPAGDYSRGMRRRLALARALLHDPELLVLDEPTAGLDPRARVAIHAELATLAGAGRTIILATHDLTEAESLCGELIVLHAGRVAASGPTRSLGAAPDVVVRGRGLDDDARRAVAAVDGVETAELCGEGLRLRLTAGTSASRAIAALLQAGVDVDEVRRDGRPLERVFIELTQDAAP